MGINKILNIGKEHVKLKHFLIMFTILACLWGILEYSHRNTVYLDSPPDKQGTHVPIKSWQDTGITWKWDAYWFGILGILYWIDDKKKIRK
jgi:hypothetical protein